MCIDCAPAKLQTLGLYVLIKQENIIQDMIDKSENVNMTRETLLIFNGNV